jgi:probable F420-dependent oxidoreductase
MQTSVVDAARQAMGPVGVCLPVTLTNTPHANLQREAVGRLERAGYGAVWTNEVIGKDALVQLAMLLAATERTVFGTCIANIWARPAQTMHAAAAQLAQGYPGRLVLGLGVGYPAQAASTGQEFGNPLATMRDYLDRMDRPTWPPAPEAPYPRIIAANGPKMLALSAEIAHGAFPAMLPPEFTAQARQVLGPDKLLVVGLTVAPDSDLDRAKGTAREAVSGRLGVPSYAATIARLGYSARDIDEVSDRLVNDIVAQGNPEAIGVKVREHVTAGADHVMLLLPTGGDFADGVDQLEEIASAYPV